MSENRKLPALSSLTFSRDSLAVLGAGNQGFLGKFWFDI
jgi:hypothetical protein